MEFILRLNDTSRWEYWIFEALSDLIQIILAAASVAQLTRSAPTYNYATPLTCIAAFFTVCGLPVPLMRSHVLYLRQHSSKREDGRTRFSAFFLASSGAASCCPLACRDATKACLENASDSGSRFGACLNVWLALNGAVAGFFFTWTNFFVLAYIRTHDFKPVPTISILSVAYSQYHIYKCLCRVATLLSGLSFGGCTTFGLWCTRRWILSISFFWYLLVLCLLLSELESTTGPAAAVPVCEQAICYKYNCGANIHDRFYDDDDDGLDGGRALGKKFANTLTDTTAMAYGVLWRGTRMSACHSEQVTGMQNCGTYWAGVKNLFTTNRIRKTLYVNATAGNLYNSHDDDGDNYDDQDDLQLKDDDWEGLDNDDFNNDDNDLVAHYYYDDEGLYGNESSFDQAISPWTRSETTGNYMKCPSPSKTCFMAFGTEKQCQSYMVYRLNYWVTLWMAMVFGAGFGGLYLLSALIAWALGLAGCQCCQCCKCCACCGESKSEATLKKDIKEWEDLNRAKWNCGAFFLACMGCCCFFICPKRKEDGTRSISGPSRSAAVTAMGDRIMQSL